MENTILQNVKRLIKDPYSRFLCLEYMGFYKKISDERFLKKVFKLLVGYDLDLNNPSSFNEKIQWLKLHDKNPLYTKLVDKHLAKEYIAKIIGEEFIVPTLGVWDSPGEIDYDTLPEKFVLKCNHNSKVGLCICKDKNKLDIKRTNKNLTKGLTQNYYIYNKEYAYKDVPKKILAEKLLEEEGTNEIPDYKFMVFNGKVRCSFVCNERFSADGLKVTFFDENWEVMPFERHYPRSKNPIPKPVNYNLMVEMAEKLAKGIRFVRVDFYEVNGKVYFGEMTFYPGSGFEEFTPREWDFRMGDWLEL